MRTPAAQFRNDLLFLRTRLPEVVTAMHDTSSHQLQHDIGLETAEKIIDEELPAARIYDGDFHIRLVHVMYKRAVKLLN